MCVLDKSFSEFDYGAILFSFSPVARNTKLLATILSNFGDYGKFQLWTKNDTIFRGGIQDIELRVFSNVLEVWAGVVMLGNYCHPV